MISITRRLKLIEAMNYCEKRGYIYSLQWSPMNMWEFRLLHPKEHDDLVAYLDRWEKE